MFCLSRYLSLLPVPTVAGATPVNIFPPDSKPYGLTFTEHAKNFWKWILPQPTNNNPADDPTGEKCLNGQANSTSQVFYLSENAGGRSERTCKVPA